MLRLLPLPNFVSDNSDNFKQKFFTMRHAKSKFVVRPVPLVYCLFLAVNWKSLSFTHERWVGSIGNVPASDEHGCIWTWSDSDERLFDGGAKGVLWVVK